MPLHLPTFLTRTGSAIVFAAVMLAGLLTGPIEFLLLLLLIQYLCLSEYFRLCRNILNDRMPDRLLEELFKVTGSLILVYKSALLPASANTVLYPLILLLFPLLIFRALLGREGHLSSLVQCASGLIYITLPLFLLFDLRIANMILPVALIVMIWVNDTMAYIVGSFLGRTPLTPISPKKTWEGTIGGAVLSIAAAAFWARYSHTVSLGQGIGLGLCASVAGTLGDLVESRLKRMAGVKDSGKILPGHGGALDRFDSLLLAAPFAAVLMLLTT